MSHGIDPSAGVAAESSNSQIHDHDLHSGDQVLDGDAFAEAFEACRSELTSYLTRMVFRPCVAEELAQTTAVKALEALSRGPQSIDEVRPWLFRIATNLAIDERRRHGSWRENFFDEIQRFSHGSGMTDQFPSWRGSPELQTVARDHLTACFSCANSLLSEQHAAALLLREVYDFSLEEISGMLDANQTRVKNWIQKARAKMRKIFERRCALISKQGVCYQCERLDGAFAAGRGNPLAKEGDHMNQRLKILEEQRFQPRTKWIDFLDQVITQMESGNK